MNNCGFCNSQAIYERHSACLSIICSSFARFQTALFFDVLFCDSRTFFFCAWSFHVLPLLQSKPQTRVKMIPRPRTAMVKPRSNAMAGDRLHNQRIKSELLTTKIRASRWVRDWLDSRKSIRNQCNQETLSVTQIDFQFCYIETWRLII